MAQSNSGINVAVSANTSNFNTGTQSAANQAQTTSTQLSQSFQNAGNAISLQLSNMASQARAAFSTISGHVGQLGNVLGRVGAIFDRFKMAFEVAKFLKERADDTAKMTGEATKLGKALGISATEAGVLNLALARADSNADDFIEASRALTEQVTGNEEAMKGLGMQTRDANNDFLNGKDMMLEAFRVLNQYREGTDRTAAAQAMFGDKADKVLELLDLNNQSLATAKERQRELGLIIGVENVAAAEEYKSAMKDVDEMMKGLVKAIGDAVMPVFTTLAQWFSVIGPAAVTVTKGAIGGLVSIFWGLKNAGQIVFEVLGAAFDVLKIRMVGLGEALGKVATGDLSGAVSALAGIEDKVTARWQSAMEKSAKISGENAEHLRQLFLPPEEAPAPSSSGKRFKAPPSKDDKDDKGDGKPKDGGSKPGSEKKSDGPGEAAAQARRKHQKELAQIDAEGVEERNKIGKKGAADELQCQVDENKASKQLLLDDVDTWQKAADDKIDIALEEAKKKLKDGEISNEKFLEIEKEFEQQRTEINRTAIEGRQILAAKEQDLVAYKKFLDKKLELEQAYLKKKKQIEDKASGKGDGKGDAKGGDGKSDGKKKGGLFDDFIGDLKKLPETMEKSLGKAIEGMLKRTMTFKQALKSVFNDIKTEFSKMTGNLLTKFSEMVAHQIKVWLFGEEVKTAATETGAAARCAAEQAASEQGLMAQAGSLIQSIMNFAAKTFAGVWSALSGIPYVGPAMAAAAAPAAMAVVIGIASRVKSASGGYDIPAGVNPMTQLHEEEMVLPAKHADVIRQLADGGGGGAGGGPVNVHITAMDARSVRDYFKANSDKLAPALRKMARNFTPTKA